jgi:hypothetical protein
MSAKDRIRQAPVHSAPAAKDQSAIRDWFCASHDRTGNLPLFPAIFPDQLAPIVRVGADGERASLSWRAGGMPEPAAVRRIEPGRSSGACIQWQNVISDEIKWSGVKNWWPNMFRGASP